MNLDVESGEILAIVGSSGSGKSTLLRIIAGSTNSTPARSTGTECAATPVRAPGVVFQKPLLMPWLTVREKGRLGGRFAANDAVSIRRTPTTSWTVSTRRAGRRVPGRELSGGQAQRVAVIARCRSDPACCWDEPFSALDPAIRGDLPELRSRRRRDLACTTILVTHEIRRGDRPRT
ncbi:ATP-binding cassette domain-containing protein, partial [Rhodococcus hoagii]|nr:ATP-binding cassette domain-containing protein [Prescottella equi]